MSNHPPTTSAEVFIEASDYVIKNCAPFKPFHPSDYLRDFDFKKYKSLLSELDWDEIVNKSNFLAVIEYMRDELGVIISTQTGEFIFTDIGREVKRLEGYKNYLEHVKEHDELPFRNLGWTKAIFWVYFAIFVLTAILVGVGIRTCRIQQRSQSSIIIIKADTSRPDRQGDNK